jgi:hypothetical protein
MALGGFRRIPKRPGAFGAAKKALLTEEASHMH